jgi:hypothetical protein
MHKFIFLRMMVLLPCFMLSIACGASASDAIWGPENQGLRMNLNIENADANQADVYKVVIKLVNAGKTPIELVAQWPYEDDKGDYKEYFKTMVGLTSFPEITTHSAQTMARIKRTSPQPNLEIKPGNIATFEWITAKRLLKPQGYYNTFPDIFPNDGLYSIQARFLATTKKGNRILLYSNDCQLAVGKSTTMPKSAMARIIQSNPDQNSVLLNVGSDQKIELNDKFRYMYFPVTHWDIRITEVNDGTSTGWTESQKTPKGIPVFPPEGSMVTLVPVGNRP